MAVEALSREQRRCQVRAAIINDWCHQGSYALAEIAAKAAVDALWPEIEALEARVARAEASMMMAE